MNPSEEKNVSEEQELPVERKLGDLMLRGWTMLAQSCTIAGKFDYLFINFINLL